MQRTTPDEAMATNISRAFFLSATTSSPTPFLYQTRTLAPISLSLRRTFDARVRQYSAQNRAAHDYERSESSFASDQDELSQDSSSQRSGSGSTSENHQPRRSYLRRRSASLSPKVRGKAQAPSSKSTKGSSTVTGQERKAFGELLGQLGIGRDDGNAHAGDAEQTQDLSSEGQERIKELMVKFGSILKDVQEKNKTSAKSKRELQKAADTEGGIPFSSGNSSSADGSSEDVGGTKLRISDLGYTEPASATSVEPEITMREAIEFVVKKESEKIEFALFQAIEEGKGDMGLWDVCKERIFSVLQHLDEGAEITMPGSDNSYGANEASGTKQATPAAGPLRIPSVVPIGPVITELYPKTLLIAFRLLNTHFPESPLIGQFRSTIKEQGRASALLGSSVALYDEMIHFYWHGCNDLPAVVSFLHDMDVTGLEPSFRTRRLLKDIVRQRQRDKDTQEESLHGQESFWEFPPNKKAFEELAGRKGWLEKLKARARESHKQRRVRYA
ncbi:uncharacterized protein N7496_002418 [Penicillium cataractarum]|uniref:Mtf2-like C-terminal domain-containing protein n=1 Tax=Penicillium cataractarum TaxID=2100454 RepID=A0A9W9VHU5_9EURO|nr:uncharacterized protein N7496_002418 [Penicillium cataractarum]KAJ5379990.1 hypothetical protein N7496_002418 [Penicillium cataractarum]